MDNKSLATTIPADQIRKAGKPVFPELRSRLRHYDRLCSLVAQREAYGMDKYGQTLMTDDGRDTPTEIVNEMLDMLAYMTKWEMQEPDDWTDRLLLRAVVLFDQIVEHIDDKHE